MTSTRRKVIFAGTGLAAGVAGLGGALWQQGHRLPQPDAAFWTQRFDRPEGGELSLAGWRGHPFLLNFWATWCAPCIKEMPLLDRFHTDQRARGVQVLGLAVDGPTPVREFLAQRPVGFPIGLAGLDGLELARALGNATGALPFSVLFDAEGRAIAQKLGALHPPDLQDWAGRVA